MKRRISKLLSLGVMISSILTSMQAVPAAADEQSDAAGTLAFAQCEEYINIRQNPDTDSEVVAKIYNHGAAEIEEQDGDWYKIRSGNAEGYVKAEYFATGAEAETIAEQAAYRVAEVYPDQLNVRTEPSEDSDVVTTASKDQELEVVAWDGDWMKVALGDDVYGYINAYYVGYNVYYPQAETLEEEQARLAAEQQAAESWDDSEVETRAEETGYEETEAPGYEEPGNEETEAPSYEEPGNEETEAPSYEEPGNEETEAPSYEEPGNEETEAPSYEEPGNEETEAPSYEEPGNEETEAPSYEEPGNEETEAPSYEEPGYEETEAPGYEEPGNEETEAPSYEEPGNEETEAPGYEEPGYEETEAPGNEETEAPAYEETEAPSTSGTGQQIADYAVQFVGNPYVWGGTSLTNGADCSGFTLSVFANFGIGLSRTAESQSYGGTSVDFGSLQPGDLLFYNSTGSIDHVAIYIGGGQIVHAANSRKGIIISDAYYQTPVCARRYW